MAEIAIEGEELVVSLSTREKIGAIQRDVRAPRSSILSISVISPPFAASRGLRIRGTAIPRLLAIGTFISKGRRTFAALHRRHPGAIVVELEGQRFATVSVSVADPGAVAAALRL